jgi:RsmE family RNA methyltransferase
VEGLAQARDTRLPELTLHRSFRKLVEDDLPTGAHRLFADADESRPLPNIRDACADLGSGERLLLAIGPEGGWVDFERELLSAERFVAVSLGPRVLRTDVACLVGLGLAHDVLTR